jgi:Methyltransferase domain
MADEYPSATVLGIDLSPIQPEYVPVNCSFRIDNVESDWVPEEKYDLIHSRAMISGIKDWPKLFKQAFEYVLFKLLRVSKDYLFDILTISRHLKPGGYIELHDFYLPAKIIDDYPIDQCKFIYYNSIIHEALKRIGVNLEAPKLWKEQLEAAGFTDIHCKWFNWPIGPWAKGKKNKLIGKLCWQNFYEGISTVAPLLSITNNWDDTRKQQYVDEVQTEMQEGKVHLYVEIGYWYAKKPTTTPATESSW